MSENIEELIEKFRQSRELYENLVHEMKYTLTAKLGELSLEIETISGRVKDEGSLRKKLNRDKYQECKNLSDIPDLAGVRILCLYDSDFEEISNSISFILDVKSCENKVNDLGIDKMGYRDIQFIVQFGSNYGGPRYDPLKGMNCEIQLRTVLQDAWAILSHHLVYKNEQSIPDRLKRDLNNVTSLLEIAQGVFENVKIKRREYLNHISNLEEEPKAFLDLPIDYDSLFAYSKWKYPQLPVNEEITNLLLRDLDRSTFKTLLDIDHSVNMAKPAVDAYKYENPDWFESGIDYVTKSLGFMSEDFRSRHRFGNKTREAFEKFSFLIKK
jgi:ppGpp synthetase/RelA/SpoT-type nucleotidyltranferase